MAILRTAFLPVEDIKFLILRACHLEQGAGEG